MDIETLVSALQELEKKIVLLSARISALEKWREDDEDYAAEQRELNE